MHGNFMKTDYLVIVTDNKGKDFFIYQLVLGKVVYYPKEDDWGHIVGFSKDFVNNFMLKIKFSLRDSVSIVYPKDLFIYNEQ